MSFPFFIYYTLVVVLVGGATSVSLYDIDEKLLLVGRRKIFAHLRSMEIE